MLGGGEGQAAPAQDRPLEAVVTGPSQSLPHGSALHRKAGPWRSPGVCSQARAGRELAGVTSQEPRRRLLYKGGDVLKIDFSAGNGIIKLVVSISIIVIIK